MSYTEQLQSCFVLHSRPWRETSMLLDVFSKKYGKVTLCARSIRGEKSQNRSLLQPFNPLYMSWKGRGELQTLTRLEPAEPAIKLAGYALYSALYLNELMVRLLHRHDPHPELFNYYNQALKKLSYTDLLEQPLREFELELLSSTGYGLALDMDINGEAISEKNNYRLDEHGFFKPVEYKLDANHHREFMGGELLLLSQRSWHNTATLKTAKRVLRLSLKSLLGDKPLQSRKLFRRKYDD